MAEQAPVEREAREAWFHRVLVEAAEVEFAEHGYDGARIQAIAARAGVALGTLYGRFKGKADLLRAVHDHRLGEVIGLADQGEVPDDPGEALLYGLATFVRWIAVNPAYLQILQREGLGWVSPVPFGASERSSTWEVGLGLLTELFAAARTSGALHEEDPARMAQLAVSALQVFVLSWTTAAPRPEVDELVQQVQLHMRRAFFRRG
jgi:AcrR family transcriptional regulator